MHASRRLLRDDPVSAAPPPEPVIVDSDIVVILAALLCALICVGGLAVVARCAWLRRVPSASPAPPNKGLKKRVLRSLPKFPFQPGHARFVECSICLTEFAEGDEIRLLPQCGHGYHVGCIDMWLASHSSCPSCRQILHGAAAAAPPKQCDKCGASSGAVAPVAAAVPEAMSRASPPAPEDPGRRAEVREDGDAFSFLP